MACVDTDCARVSEHHDMFAPLIYVSPVQRVLLNTSAKQPHDTLRISTIDSRTYRHLESTCIVAFFVCICGFAGTYHARAAYPKFGGYSISRQEIRRG